MDSKAEKSEANRAQIQASTVSGTPAELPRTNSTGGSTESLSERTRPMETGPAKSFVDSTAQAKPPTDTLPIRNDVEEHAGTGGDAAKVETIASQGATKPTSMPHSASAKDAPPTSVPTNVHTGNDKVSVDQSKQPLTRSEQTPVHNSDKSDADAMLMSFHPVVAPSIFTPPASKIAKKSVSFSGSIEPKPAEPPRVNASDTNRSESSESKQIVTPRMPQPAEADAAIAAPGLQPAPDETTSVEDAIQRLRAPLVDEYTPYIHASDTCLEDARKRLRTALDQTRYLRATFTERVYEKYRVLLRPVPKSIKDMVDPVLADPAAAHQRITKEIRLLKEEKDLEKREAQKLAAAKSTVGADGVVIPTPTTETLDQLAFIGAGLSLVVLPEEDIDEDEIEIKGFETRGPTNPETGQRVPGISSAAAAAAEVLLDRTRRSTALRIERERRRQLRIMTGQAPDGEADDTSSALASLHLLSSSTTRTDPPRPAHGKVGKTGKRGSTKKGSPPFQSPPGTGKPGRGRNTISLTGNTLLSLNPSAEELSNDGKPCAATLALISLGVGSANSKVLQQRWRHPHPESAGARRSVLPPASSAAAFSPAGLASLALPPLPVGKQLKGVKAVPVMDPQKSCSESARTAIENVLRQFSGFAEKEDSSEPTQVDETEGTRQIDDGLAAGDKDTSESNPTKASEDDASHSKMRLCATEIGLLHKLQYPSESDEKTSERLTGESRSDEPTASSSLPASPPIDPKLAFSVLHALGLIKGVDTSEDVPSSSHSLDQINPSIFERSSEGNGDSESKIKRLYESISSRKRLFSHSIIHKSGTDSSAAEPQPAMPAPDPVADKEQAKEPQEPNRKKMKVETGESGNAGPCTRDPLKPNECPVLPVRGGGEAAEGSTDENSSKAEPTAGKEGTSTGHESLSDLADENANDESEKSGHVESSIDPPGALVRNSSAPGASIGPPVDYQRNTPSSIFDDAAQRQPYPRWDEQSSPFSSSRADVSYSQSASSHPEQSATFSPPRSVRGRPRSQPSVARTSPERLQHQAPAHAMPLHHGAVSMHHLPAGDLSDYYGLVASGQRAGAISSGHDWASIGMLPTHSSLGALGMTPHRAAMMSLSVRDRAARAMLMQEQNAAAAAHALAAHRHASIAALSPQQAAALMSSQSNYPSAGVYSQEYAAPSRYSGYGAHAAASYLSAEIPQTRSPSRTVSAPAAGASRNGESSFSRTEAKESSKRSDGKKPVRSRPVATSPPRGRTDTKKEKKSSTDSNQAASKSIKNARKTETSNARKQGSSTARKPAAPMPTTKVTELHGADSSSARGPGVDAKQSTSAVGKGSSLQTEALLPQPKSIATATSAHVEKENTPGPSNSDVRTGDQNTANLADEIPATTTTTAGMRFFVPATPQTMPEHIARLIMGARFHEASAECSSPQVPLIEFLIAVGAAVPIPKALIANPLKDRLNSPGFKNHGAGTIAIPRDVITATILVWLWAQHKESFLRAFAKSGRIDVDPECKWLINAAVDASVLSLIVEIADSVARGGSLGALGGSRAKSGTGGTKQNAAPQSSEDQSGPSTDVHVASVVNRALMKEFVVDAEMDKVLPVYGELVQMLDACRIYALQEKARERVLLAALVSRKATMSESFSHAYTSAMVRAGEGLGHNDLFELAQEESATMIPYDIFTDETGAWEDPCRPPDGFTPNLTGEDLVRRAHARAMIQKSLKKLQDKNNIRGGTPTVGPYAEVAASPGSSRAASPTGSQTAGSQRSLKRKPSFAGSEASTSTQRSTLFNPNHYSSPLFWDFEDVGNKPYGKYTKGFRVRSSIGRMSFDEDDSREPGSKRRRISRSSSMSLPLPPPREEDTAESTGGPPRSTEEIDWADVARIFQPVALPDPNSVKQDKHEHAVPAGSTIIAPFCRRIGDKVPDSDDDDAVSEEDLSDEAVLARHQVVLDRMKEKLDRVMAARQQAQPQRARGPRTPK